MEQWVNSLGQNFIFKAGWLDWTHQLCRVQEEQFQAGPTEAEEGKDGQSWDLESKGRSQHHRWVCLHAGQTSQHHFKGFDKGGEAICHVPKAKG